MMIAYCTGKSLNTSGLLLPGHNGIITHVLWKGCMKTGLNQLILEAAGKIYLEKS